MLYFGCLCPPNLQGIGRLERLSRQRLSLQLGPRVEWHLLPPDSTIWLFKLVPPELSLDSRRGGRDLRRQLPGMCPIGDGGSGWTRRLPERALGGSPHPQRRFT